MESDVKHYSGQTGNDVWFRMLVIEEEKGKKAKYCRDKDAKKIIVERSKLR